MAARLVMPEVIHPGAGASTWSTNSSAAGMAQNWAMAKTPGRPITWNPELGAQLLEAIADPELEGYQPAAAERCGVALRTLKRWLARGRAGDERFAEFATLWYQHKRTARCNHFAERTRHAACSSREDRNRLGPVHWWRRRLLYLYVHQRWDELNQALDEALREGVCVREALGL
jgi:hypothetical protein